MNDLLDDIKSLKHELMKKDEDIVAMSKQLSTIEDEHQNQMKNLKTKHKEHIQCLEMKMNNNTDQITQDILMAKQVMKFLISVKILYKTA